jgi:hypothetical protein
MPVVSGKSSPARALSTIELVGPLTAGRLVFLALLGVLTIVLHDRFNLPLKMPGHHGLEAMALLVLGRLSCTNRWSATIVALSAALTAFGTGADHNPSSLILTAAPGIVLDLAVMLFPSWRAQVLVLPVLVAFAFALKPLIRLLLAQGFGVQFGSLSNGVLYPMSSHFVYAFAGGLLAVLMWRAAEMQRESRGLK